MELPVLYTQPSSPYNRLQASGARARGVEAAGRPQVIRPAQAVTFGSCGGSNKLGNEKVVFETYVPKPVKSFQWLMYTLNRLSFVNPWVSWLGFRSNEVKLADSASQQNLTKKIPNDAGVILVGPHPDLKDAHLLAELHRQAGQYPACTLINSEMIQKFGNYVHPCLMNYLVKPIFSMLGLIPLNRGGKNPEVKKYTVDSIAAGKWNSLFPEGDIRMGPHVFPMQKGAVEMAIQAAIQSDFKRPIMLVPFAHTWTYKSPEKAEKELFKVLAKLESKVLQERKSTLLDVYSNGSVQERIFRVGNQILDLKLQTYGLSKPPNWEQLKFYERAQYLRREGMSKLEQKYGIPIEPNRLEHNRLMRIRSAAWEKLSALPPGERRRNPEAREKFDDLECAQELSYLSAFQEGDVQAYGDRTNLDPEMLACYTLRLSALMGLGREQLSDRQATVKVLEPIDMREKARIYQQLETQQEKDEYAIHLTQELLQEPIQQEVNRVRQQAMQWKSLATRPGQNQA